MVCWAMFVGFLLVPLGVVHWVQASRGTRSIRQLNSDFVYVYGLGQIARHYSFTRIYDVSLQQQVFLSIQPPRDGTIYGPSPYPPFVAMFFAPFTYLSFEEAYLLWLGISLILYLVGVGAASKAIFPGEPLKASLILCFALAFYPFIFGTLLNGQLSTIAICAIGLAIYQERLGNLFRSGLALALLCYKPTLLLLLIPMLLLTRRFKASARICNRLGSSHPDGHCVRGSTDLACICAHAAALWTPHRPRRRFASATLEISGPQLIFFRSFWRQVGCWNGAPDLRQRQRKRSRDRCCGSPRVAAGQRNGSRGRQP